MCGFIRRVTDNPYVKAVLLQIGMDHIDLIGGDFRPAATLSGLITNQADEVKSDDAIWWFLLDEQKDFTPNMSFATFNARDLQRPLWRQAIDKQRGLVIATAIGESSPIAGTKKKQQYLMQAENVFLLGAVYRQWQTPAGEVLSTAIITRPPTSEFAKFHEKSMPLFLPHNAEQIALWLSDLPSSDPRIKALLDHPKIYNNIKVTPVKSYVRSEPNGPTQSILGNN